MDISMYTVYALSQNFASPVEAFRHFYEKGIRYADIVDDELSQYPLHLYCDYLREAQLQPNVLVSMLDTASFDDKKRDIAIANVKGYIDQMEKLNIPYIMLAPNVIPATNSNELKRMQERLISGFISITEYAKSSGVKVIIENQSTLTRADSKMDDICDILNCVPELGFVLDTGNFFCVQDDVLTAFRLLSNRIVHVHAKDWKFDEYGAFVRENMPRFDGAVLGKGVVPLKEIFAMLKTEGYNGKINLEINAGKITLDMLDKSAEFLRSELNV